MPLQLLALSPNPRTLSEKEVQTAFEHNYEGLETGLKRIASFVGTGVGIIDSLAIDEDNNPVVLEFKKPGRPAYAFGIQAMDYAVWFRENFSWIEKTIQSSGHLGEVSRAIRIIVVASDFDERIKHAARGVEFDVQLISFGIYEHSGSAVLVPRVDVDTSASRAGMNEPLPPKTKQQHFLGRSEKIIRLYEQFEKKMKEIPNVDVNYQPQEYIRFKFKGSNFVAAHPKREWIRLDFRLAADEAQMPGYVGQSGEWGYYHLTESTFDNAMQLVSTAIKKFQDANGGPAVLPSVTQTELRA